MAERLNVPPWKGGIGVTLSGVRIPLSPPLTVSSRRVVMTYPMLAVVCYRTRASSSSNPRESLCRILIILAILGHYIVCSELFAIDILQYLCIIPARFRMFLFLNAGMVSANHPLCGREVLQWISVLFSSPQEPTPKSKVRTMSWAVLPSSSDTQTSKPSHWASKRVRASPR